MALMQRLQAQAMRAYVEVMMGVIGRGLVAVAHEDAEVARELRGFPDQMVLQFMVLPDGPSFALRVVDGRFQLLRERPQRVDLGICFKHVTHAFLVFSFQESTAQAFAHDRMYVTGDISLAIRLVRCLTRMEALILPAAIARLAVKRYPEISFIAKVQAAGKIYGRLAYNMTRGE